ncbi:biogenesis of lysosome-related organelles complex 1 subunit 4 isoform X1 [Ascaphus truei]|uniref:biogenesis of lysosome-related organelles complex 1 subunit 4 isoform X1 n=1 Tax=Ascaphus truei TaxID=8439 RepID=UPI003F5A07E0
MQDAGEEAAARSSPADSGNVSQSHSACSGASGLLAEGEEWGAGASPSDALIREAASGFSACLLPEDTAGQEIEGLEKSLEDLLIRVDEFVGMLDMIRNDTSQVVNEKVPVIYAKAGEMRKLYSKIDLLEAFVKKVGSNVTLMEEQVTQAETNLGAFPNPFKKIFRNISVPPFFSPAKSASSPRQPHMRYEPPIVLKTEDYFSNNS